MSSKITTQLAVDGPLQQTSSYRFNARDRQYIDDQARGAQQHLVDSLIRGRLATYFTLDTGSEAVAAGDVVCLASSLIVAPYVTKATALALSKAKSITGVVVYPTLPGGNVLVAVGGVLPPAITGLAANAAGFVKVNTTTARCEMAAGYMAGDYGVGSVDGNGFLQVIPGVTAGLANAAFVPIGAENDMILQGPGGDLKGVTTAGVPVGYVWQVLAPGVLGWGPSPGGVSVFDPATLSLSGWWKNFTGAPWVGSSSTGASSGRQLQVGTAPTVGTAVNGKTPASFNGTNQYLLENTLTANNYLTASAYTIVLLVKASGGLAPEGLYPFDDKQLITIGGGGLAAAGISLTSSGIRAWHQTASGSNWNPTTGYITFPGGVYAMVVMQYNGTNLSISLNNGTAITEARANIVDLAGTVIRLATTYNTGKFTQEDVLEVMTAPTVLTSGNLGNIKSYFNSTYSLSL